MKRKNVFLVLLLLVALALSNIMMLSSCRGKKYTVPNFTVYNTEGKEVELEDFIGKPIVLNFWATWCYYCTLEMPDFEEAYKAHPEVTFLMVNATDNSYETVAKASEYIKNEGFTFPVYYDTLNSAQQAYEVTAYPMTFFIDKNGDLVKTHRGQIKAAVLEENIALITAKK